MIWYTEYYIITIETNNITFNIELLSEYRVALRKWVTIDFQQQQKLLQEFYLFPWYGFS